jgi:hypothetical protein
MPDALRVMVVHGLEDLTPLPPFREEDMAEVVLADLTLDQAIDGSIQGSTRSFAVYLEDKLLCVWGYRRCGPAADVWLLTTEEVDLHPFAFLRESRRLLRVLLDTFTTLRCEVAVDYTKTRRWLTRIGFVSGADSLLPGFITYQIGGANGRA